MKTINTYISEKLKISVNGEIDFDRFIEEFRIYAKNVSSSLDLKQFNLNLKYYGTELYIFDFLIYDEHYNEIYIRAHNKYNTRDIQQFKLRNIHDWIRYFVLHLNLPESKNESEALKQIKKITLYLQSKDPESMMSDYDAEFI